MSAIVLALAGVVLEFLVFKPVRNAGGITPFIAALGALIILENAVVVLWGPEGHRIPNPYPGIIDAFGITMSTQRLLVIGVAIVLILLLQIFIKKTTLGSSIEAVAQNKEGATLVGINVNRVSALTFAISSGLAAVAACLVAPIFMISPSMGSIVGMKAFVIVILGGHGQYSGGDCRWTDFRFN